ncbi:uncharacterized protein LOC131248856 isoform X4 [Magnolia sinica]|uniref:uncharacterized protein LOC131248856 isoform X4 n=1 Tax=Magnolia sinica TaxID=86752 RepID=UPI00265B2312|nr:uncharacterized protein LOC131248856 isoform X4 [Magnolia sinica]
MPEKFIFFLGFLSAIVSLSSQESSTCLTVYKEGGAPAVFQSPKCPRWTLSTDGLRRRATNCQSAVLQGRRNHQEDRTLCVLDMRIPFPSRMGVKEVSVGIVAVFDGHNGAEASEMASKLLFEYFLLHIYFLLDGIYSVALKKSADRLPYRVQQDVFFHVFNQYKESGQHNPDPERFKLTLPRIFDGSFHMEILKESLLRTIRDIDATFSKEAYKYNLESGSTATIVLIADDQILVANIGDSKALLCSKCFRSPHELKGTLSKLYGRKRHHDAIFPAKEHENIKLVASKGSTYFCAKELTKDHHPDRDDERTRVEAAGGYVIEWGGVPRVNGELAISRAIGDVSFKSYGVISVPEVTDWQPLTSNDSYLVAATDGVFEKMTVQDICDLIWDVHIQDREKSEPFCTNTKLLADCIVNTAFERGSMDNVAAVVVPLASDDISRTQLRESCDLDGSVDSSARGMQKLIDMNSGFLSWPVSTNDAISSGLIPMEFVHKTMATFKRLLVEGPKKKIGCFYLSENLNENIDYVFHAQRDDMKNDVYDLPQALPNGLGHHHSGGSLGLYNDKNLCLHFGMDIEGAKGQCMNPDGFASFLGLLESIPFNDTVFNSSASFGYDSPDSRYILKRRFDRGSYGEVYLAFHWNCSQEGDTLNRMNKTKTCSVNSLHVDPCDTSSQANSSSQHCFTDSDSEDLFILKRIMVERGITVYLSGLREKHFGELFLNASLSFGGLISERLSKSFSSEDQFDPSCLLQMNKSVLNEKENIFSSNFKMLTSDHEEGLMHIARFVESFESQSKEIWLVFRNEGLSLSKVMYSTGVTKTVIGGEKHGQTKSVQLMALKSCHDRNIIHRDIKPENMVICFEDGDMGRCLRGSPSGEKQYHINMRIIDFGSAIDEFTVKHLYGSNGPSRSEQTFEYTPPEALLNASWFQGPTSVTLKYDMWSVGVVMLELILGSPHVFQISARTRALLDQHLEGWSESTKDLAYKLRSLMEMCILIPGSSPQHHSSGMKDQAKAWLASWKCSEEFFSQLVKNRDPLKIGFPNVWALRLVRQLLQWHPEDRLSVDEALRHPYFQLHPQA